MATLAELERVVLACTACPLSEGRTQAVFGVGDPEADLMFVGEAPGKEEDLRGEPFVGRAGKLLDRLLAEEMGISRERCYIANVLKCLRYKTMVQLGDGSWERIGRLVRTRYSGEVMSVDESGFLVPRRVVGWHATPLAGRRVFRISYTSAKRNSLGRAAAELTGDHPVLTDEGYVLAQDLVPGARVSTGQGLSDVAFDVVCGTLLGDGHLSRNRAGLSFAHSARQADYAEMKARLLGELGPSVERREVAAAVGSEVTHPVVMVRTKAHRALWTLREAFYRPRKGFPAQVAARLTPRMLAFWFMDDGHLRLRPPRRPSAEIATNAFSEDDLATAVLALRRLGLTARPLRGRLHFDVVETPKLSALIAPYVPPSMRYKLTPEVAASVPFDEKSLTPGPPRAMFDEVEVEDITATPRTDVAFFCIDVEGTHNFVTAGGVVHNCRPPGNRDPRPAEIASCRPFLEHQIQLIDPKVIVTLGNFATKLLLDTTDGITKVRGKTYAYGSAILVPTFHPSAALQGGGSDVIAKMRADLVRAKRALASR